MHVFPYSQRKGTRASTMANQIDGNLKEIRSKKLIELSRTIGMRTDYVQAVEEIYLLNWKMR